MRKVEVGIIEQAVEKAVIEANTRLPADVLNGLRVALERETLPRARHFLQVLLENAEIAVQENMAICQDTGLALVYLELGQDITLSGGDLIESINRGIRQGYQKGYFRKSVVKDPFNRINTGDNTPAIVHAEIVPGDKLRLTVLPKGGGSENMGCLAMLKPAQGLEGVKDFVVQAVAQAGGNPCPPVIIGVGVGGSMDYAAWLAKKALLRPIDRRHSEAWLAEVELELKDRINRLGIGPQGLGGNTTALAVNIEVHSTHIASLPVAVNFGCHATRRVTVII